MLISAIVIVWLICGFLSWGWGFAYFQREWPGLANQQYSDDLSRNIISGMLFGPIGLISTIIVCRPFRGFKWI